MNGKGEQGNRPFLQMGLGNSRCALPADSAFRCFLANGPCPLLVDRSIFSKDDFRMSRKRALESFFTPASQKKARPNRAPSEPTDLTPTSQQATDHPTSTHSTYPFPVPHLPPHIQAALSEIPASEGRQINDQPDLDLLYFQPFIPSSIENELFKFLRKELFFYRVKYKIKRGGVQDFAADTAQPEQCLDALRRITEVFTNSEYNFCLVNYYASGSDSISYHSDDERFLGALPSIASFSLGTKRDFCMKHKPVPPDKDANDKISDKPLKLPLSSGDMVLMRGTTQANWLHSIPKRSGKGTQEGRINITFRKALVKGGTENYYRYNVGDGGVWRWDEGRKEMKEWNNGS
ncbi:MAG: hypothetical protein Q9195_008226 [Heterodermia aff. obscurata]